VAATGGKGDGPSQAHTGGIMTRATLLGLVASAVVVAPAGLPARAGELGAAYAIPILYVPLLMITHVVAFYFLARPSARQAAA